MIDASNILAIADSHFTLHVLGPDEADVAAQGEAVEEGALPAEAGGGSSAPLPENLIEDFLDEAAAMLEETADLYAQNAGWERALMFGFADGVLAAADDSWSALEDAYFEDAGNPDFAVLDEAIALADGAFDGSRPWDEAAKGYVRSQAARSEGGLGANDQAVWAMCAHGFIYGVDAGYDQEWKVMVTPAGNILLTDEDSIAEAALAQAGAGSLIDRVFDMMGIDLDELAAAIGAEEGAEDEAEGDGADEQGGRLPERTM